MADNNQQLVLGSLDSLWHYGLPPSTLPFISPAQAVQVPSSRRRACPSNLPHCSNLPSCTEASVAPCKGSSLRSVFSLIDEDGDGQISLCEIHSLLARLGLRSNYLHQGAEDDPLAPLIQSTSSPNQHHDDLQPSLDFPQFAQLYASVFRPASHEALHGPPHAGDDNLDDELLDAFRIYDTNHDGFISAAELAAVLSDLKLLPAAAGAIEAHVGQCQAYIDSVDLDGNGMVDLHEFKAMMMTSSRHSIAASAH